MSNESAIKKLEAFMLDNGWSADLVELTAKTIRLRQAVLPSIYLTDDYPRAGCRILIDVPGRGCDSWVVGIDAPREYDIPFLERYGAKSLETALLIAGDLASGRQVPKHYNDGGYPSSTS